MDKTAFFMEEILKEAKLNPAIKGLGIGAGIGGIVNGIRGFNNSKDNNSKDKAVTTAKSVVRGAIPGAIIGGSFGAAKHLKSLEKADDFAYVTRMKGYDDEINSKISDIKNLQKEILNEKAKQSTMDTQISQLTSKLDSLKKPNPANIKKDLKDKVVDMDKIKYFNSAKEGFGNTVKPSSKAGDTGKVVEFKKQSMVEEIIEEIHKEAMARAWKTNIGNLGRESINKLKSSGVLDHAKELKGLNKGTENIVKRHGGRIGNFSADDFGKAMGKEIDNSKAIKKQLSVSGANKEDVVDAIKDMHKMNDGFMSLSGKNQKLVSKGTVQKGGLIDQLMDSNNKRKFNNKYTEAILNRHEADELRFGQKSFVGRKNNVKLDGEKIPAGQYGSHLSPKVLGAESVNTAVAPPAVKEKFMNLRRNSSEKSALGHVGLNYGESGKYNKQINAKIQRMQVAANKPQYKEMFGAE